jgi:hypothetical protein
MKLALVLLLVGVAAQADTSAPVPGESTGTEAGPLRCDGVRHVFALEVSPGESLFVWRGDRGCEGAGATVLLDRDDRGLIVSQSRYDGGEGVVRLRVTNRSSRRVRIHVVLFGAYA